MNPTTAGYVSLQQKRRSAALERQRAARSRQINLSRLMNNNAAEDEEGETEEGQDSPTTSSAPPGQHMEATDPTSTATSGTDASMTDITTVTGGGTHVKGRRRPGPGRPGLARESGGGEKARQFWSQQLQQPEWMTDIPSDLGTSWLVRPKPEGQRCVVVTARGSTVVRGRNGAVLAMAATALPEGGPGTLGGSRDFCVLDAVWHQPNNTLYLLDVMVWKGYALYDCTAEFRAFWLQAKLSEDPVRAAALAAPVPAHFRLQGPAPMEGEISTSTSQQGPAVMGQAPQGAPLEGGQQGPGDAQQVQMAVAEMIDPVTHQAMADVASKGAGAGQHGRQQAGSRRAGRHTGKGVSATRAGQPAVFQLRVMVLPFYVADAAGLQAAYHAGRQSDCDFTCQDGLYLLHKEAHYHPGMSTPLALQWKDAACSAWFVDTDAQGGQLSHQVVTLEFRMDGSVATSDEVPVVLGMMPQAWVQSMGPKLLQPGRLLRFTIHKGGIMWAPDGRPAGADLHYEGAANIRRGHADAFSKVLFQHMVRTQPLTMAQLLAQTNGT